MIIFIYLFIYFMFSVGGVQCTTDKILMKTVLQKGHLHPVTTQDENVTQVLTRSERLIDTLTDKE
jgi:hypothetical protein